MEENGATTESLFRQEGAVWAIAFDGRRCHLPDARGLRYLAHLLRHPGVAVPVVELIATIAPSRGDLADANGPDSRERARITVTKCIRAALRKIGDAHPVLARHLEATIKRGYVCRYLPDPRVPIRWEG